MHEPLGQCAVDREPAGGHLAVEGDPVVARRQGEPRRPPSLGEQRQQHAQRAAGVDGGLDARAGALQSHRGDGAHRIGDRDPQRRAVGCLVDDRLDDARSGQAPLRDGRIALVGGDVRTDAGEDLVQHALGGSAVDPVDVLFAQPGGVPGDASTERRVGADGVEVLENVRPRVHVAVVAEDAVVLVQSPLARVLLDIRGEEDRRAVDEGEVVGDRRVVGDEGVDAREHRGDVDELRGAQHPDALRHGGAGGVVAESERMDAHQQHGVARLEPTCDERPVLAGGGAGVVGTVAPGGGVEDDAGGIRHRARRLGDEGARGGTQLGRVAPEEGIVADVAHRDHAPLPHAEGARDAGGDELGRHGEQVDPAARETVRPGEERPHEAVVGDPADAQGGGGVEVQFLERDAVPELHDEGPARAVPVDVAEAVGDDEHPGAERDPEAARGVLRDRVEAARRARRPVPHPWRRARRAAPAPRAARGRAGRAAARLRRARCRSRTPTVSRCAARTPRRARRAHRGEGGATCGRCRSRK